jgi:ribosomal protein S18 acetylase RimI-like enzyme
MSNIEWLEWDSNFFGLRIGKKVIKDFEHDFNPDGFHEEAKRNYDLVYIMSFNKLISPEKFHSIDIELIDIQIEMSMPFKPLQGHDFNILSSPTDQELIECYRIAEEVSSVSRFSKEPLIGISKAKSLYRAWVDNAIEKKIADGILIHKSNEFIKGIHIVKTDLTKNAGYCSMIGVKKEDAHKGIGKALWEQARRYWTAQKNIEKCHVVFSLTNIQSMQFHINIGFNSIEEIRYIYHYRNNG